MRHLPTRSDGCKTVHEMEVIHKDTHTHTCAHQFLKPITQSGAKQWAISQAVVPSFSLTLLPSFSLYSHPWHVMINWVLSEFSGWPGLQEAAIPSHPPPSTLHSFITSSLHHLSITFHPFLHQQIWPFLFHSGWIVSLSFTLIRTLPPSPPPHPPCSTRHNWLVERVVVKLKCGHKHEMKTWMIHERKSILNGWQEKDVHFDFST